LNKYFLVLVLLFIIPFTVSAINITNISGASYIKWAWDDVNHTKNVYIDTNLILYNTSTLGYYELYGLNQNEEHIITIQDLVDNLTSTQSTKTLDYYWYLPLLFAIGCIIVGTKIPLFNVVSILVSFYGFSQIFIYTSQLWLYIVYGFIIIISIVALKFELGR